MSPTGTTKTGFQRHLLDWFHQNSRDLPWRRTYSPYHVWISEIMLQQTQADRVIGFFERWCRRLPTIGAVAAADEETILKLWEGLGYYSRARNIHRSARILVRDHGGRLPEDHGRLLDLPGIGPYTAGAIMSLAFNRDYPVVDGNVERIMARLHDIAGPVKEKSNHARIWRLAGKLIPAGEARNFNQAMMELGALVCLPKSPACPSCPVRRHCEALANHTVSIRPEPRTLPQTVRIEMATAVLRHNRRVFIQKRPPTGVWANLWEFPGGRLEPGETPREAVLREFLEETEIHLSGVSPITTVQHSYLHYRVVLHCFSAEPKDPAAAPVLHAAQEYRWVTADELADYAFPAGHRKLIEHLHQTRGFEVLKF